MVYLHHQMRYNIHACKLDDSIAHSSRGCYFRNTPSHVFAHSQPPRTYYEDAVGTRYSTAFPFALISANAQDDVVQKNPGDEYLKDRYVLNKLAADD